MELTNFTLRYPHDSVELIAFGLNWDLHNFANFQGLEFEPRSGDVVMEWRVTREPGSLMWCDPQNAATACRLRFSGVTLLRMGARDDAYPATENDCVAGINIVTHDGPERLAFDFQDERLIEIAARTVTLERDLPP